MATAVTTTANLQFCNKLVFLNKGHLIRKVRLKYISFLNYFFGIGNYFTVSFLIHTPKYIWKFSPNIPKIALFCITAKNQSNHVQNKEKFLSL